MTNKQKYCEFCHVKPESRNGLYDEYGSRIHLAGCGETQMYIAAKNDGTIEFQIFGDECNDHLPINFCPFCGRDLKNEKNCEDKDNG